MTSLFTWLMFTSRNDTAHKGHTGGKDRTQSAAVSEDGGRGIIMVAITELQSKFPHSVCFHVSGGRCSSAEGAEGPRWSVEGHSVVFTRREQDGW